MSARPSRPSRASAAAFPVLAAVVLLGCAAALIGLFVHPMGWAGVAVTVAYLAGGVAVLWVLIMMVREVAR